MELDCKRYVITDKDDNYYCLDQNNQLVVVTDSSEVTCFRYSDAEARISSGKKAQFYNIVPVEDYEEAEERKNTKLNYDLNTLNWHEYLKHFLYVNSMIKGHEEMLLQKLSNVDMEISDLLHYIELMELTDSKSLDIIDQIRDCRERRRQIKDQMYAVEQWQKAFSYQDLSDKVKASIKQMKKLDYRTYSPRVLNDLFNGQKRVKKQNIPNTPCHKIGNEENVKFTIHETVEEYYENGEINEEMENRGGELMVEQNNNEQNQNEQKREGIYKMKERKETIFDGKKNDWLEMAKTQMMFFGNVQQYMTNLELDIERLDREINDLLIEIESACCNVTQGYKVFKRLKDLRVERREKDKELQCLETMVGCFDCIYMEDSYRYSVGTIMEIMMPTDKKEKVVREGEAAQEIEMINEIGA